MSVLLEKELILEAKLEKELWVLVKDQWFSWEPWKTMGEHLVMTMMMAFD